jgi:hypothetical protein
MIVCVQWGKTHCISDKQPETFAQASILCLKLRLASLAPELEPPLDYRPNGYTADEALAVMKGYGTEARMTAVMLEVGTAGKQSRRAQGPWQGGAAVGRRRRGRVWRRALSSESLECGFAAGLDSRGRRHVIS